jgi:thymidylate synthase ThyX
MPPTDRRSTDVYAIYGVAPEVMAYAMAKYSRSSLSLKESLGEISGQKAEKFLNTFYFQYGHRSIADLAHIAFALERLSLVAAIAVADEPRWDGQERSTRYQDFSRPDYYRPDFAADAAAGKLYGETIEFLFAEYRAFSDAMFRQLCAATPRPAEMTQEQYERTLRARAFDIARYLLPLATNTSLGQIVNARTLENQIARLRTSRYAEVRELGDQLRAAALNPAFSLTPETIRSAPTLVKYAEASAYAAASRDELAAAADDLMQGAPVAPAPAVDLLDDDPVEIELATTLLYEHCHYSYRQLRQAVTALSAPRRDEIVALGTRHRGRHDELLRAFCSGYRFRFDLLMDIGAFRDLHRHRRCIQIGQDYTAAHGYDVPDAITGEWLARYRAALERAAAGHAVLASAADPAAAAYLLPLAYRKRTLFKMDFAEVLYIAELRTAPAGHFSYRNIAWQMYERVAERHPSLAACFRVHDPRGPADLLQR